MVARKGSSSGLLLQQLLSGNLEDLGEFLHHLLLLETGFQELLQERFHMGGGWGHCVHAHIFHQCGTHSCGGEYRHTTQGQ